ncbi:MAG: hypothetical protein GXO73_01480 [Calditrichaeota bacterium]|nr:hypothetical protein [Calditrichota bacterium]
MKVGARDDRGLAGFAFVVEEPNWSNGNGMTVWMVQDSVWSCEDSISVRFQTTSDTFYVYGLAFDKAGNCSRVDSALVYVTRPPEVSLTVFDARDPQDSVYVNYPVQTCVGGANRDSVLIRLSWARVDSIVIQHGAESFRLVVPAYTGSTEVRTTIASRCGVSYYDSLTALAYQLGVVGARRTYIFVVDHQAPSVQAVEVVSGPNSAEVVPFVSQPEAWVLVRASDAAPARKSRAILV